jgi:hypothetical protein
MGEDVLIKIDDNYILVNHQKMKDNPISTTYKDSMFYSNDDSITESKFKVTSEKEYCYMFKKGNQYYVNGYDFRIMTKDKSKVDELFNQLK